ncbi:hypothetical protein ACHAXR_004529 [Thalassiosira sp. AJA248-18]
MLNLEAPDTHRRSKTGTLHNRKKRSNFRARITKEQIKKAYRKQAQLFHPDKASRHNMTTSEATSRFAEIAEAYQVLVDPAQRYEYDWDLLEMEEEYEEERQYLEEEQRELKRQQRYEYGNDSSSLYDKIRNGASNFQDWKSTLNLDPWAVFEDFFFQDSAMGNANINPNTEEYRYHQAQNPNSYNHQSNEGREHHSRPSPSNPTQQMPPRVSETTIFRGYDPSFGADVYTVLRREEFIHDVNDNGEYYYRILGQDFISGTRVDPFTGFTMQEYYSAVTEPYFVEEGYSKQNSHAGENSNYEGTNFHYKEHEQQQTQHRKSPSKLEEGESLIPHITSNEDIPSNPWISPNGKYEAMLTPTCELQIVRRDEQQKLSESSSTIDDAVIWSSETYIPNTRAHGCYLTLNSMGRLILSVDYGSGLGSTGNTVLWNTPLPHVVPHWYKDEDENAKQQPVTFRYYASLDDDGVIAIYRVREILGDGASGASDKREKDTINEAGSNANTPNARNNDTQTKLQIRPIIDRIGVMYHRISKSSAEQGQTKAAFAWNQLRYNVGRIFAGRPWTASNVSGDQSGVNSHHECIYSTSPVGCLAPGRNAIHLTKKIARSLKRSVQSIDSHLDHFLSALTEPAVDYDYDDYSYGYNPNTEYGSPGFDDDDDDDDILDTLLRVTGAAGYAGAQLGKAGMHAAQLGVKRGRKVAGKVVGKMKDRMGKHSIQWGERMAENEEVDEYF